MALKLTIMTKPAIHWLETEVPHGHDYRKGIVRIYYGTP